MVKALLKRFILIYNGDVADLVELMEALDSVLDEFSELYCAFYRI